MTAVTIPVELPPGVTITAYQRVGDGPGFWVSWPLPPRCRGDRCRREEDAAIEYRDAPQVARDLAIGSQPRFWIYRPAFHRCPCCHHRQALIPPFKRKDTSYT